MWGNERDQIAIGFRLAYDWLSSWREVFKPITRCNCPDYLRHSMTNLSKWSVKNRHWFLRLIKKEHFEFTSSESSHSSHIPWSSFSTIFVPAFEVLFKVSRLSESLSAMLTWIRFVAGVSAAVHGETAWTQESFATQATEKLLLAHSLLGTLFFVVDKPNKSTSTDNFHLTCFTSRVKPWVKY